MTDNDGEYRGLFKQHCRSHEIRLEKGLPKTPQQNGVAEIMNITIEEMIKCMLSDAKLLESSWAEAMCTTLDLINISLSALLNGDIPKRVWIEKDVSYKYLRVFGCRTYVHIPKDKISKPDNKVNECIFLSYGHDEFEYI